MVCYAQTIRQSGKLTLAFSFVAAALVALPCHGGEDEGGREASTIRIGVLSTHLEPQPHTSQGQFLTIARMAGMQASCISAKEVRAGLLDELDILVIGAGNATQYGELLGAEGGKVVEEFVRRGGGVIGASSGGYLIARGETPPLNYVAIANARLLFTEEELRDRQRSSRSSHWAEVETSNGEQLGPMAYITGPLWEITDADGIGTVKPLAKFVSRPHAVQADTAPRVDDLTGKPAIIAGTFGTGRFVLFSISPEMVPGVGHSLAESALHWVAGGKPNQAEEISWHNVFSSKLSGDKDAEAGKDEIRQQDKAGFTVPRK